MAAPCGSVLQDHQPCPLLGTLDGGKLEIEMSDKWNNLTSAHRKMAIAREAIGQSEENLRLNRAYYDAGMCTVTDMLEAEALNRQAEDDFTAAYGAFCVAYDEYLNATGR